MVNLAQLGNRTNPLYRCRAKESNEVNCLNVWPNYKRKYELSGPYYRENILVEEKMLARAALRMASIIDFLGKL